MKRLFVGASVLAACAYACDSGPESHVYVAALYAPASACFGPSVSLGYIDTPDGDLDCAPTCIVNDSPPGGGAHLVYVSTMCGPYPPTLDTTQTDPGCSAALAAWPAEEAALVNGTDSCASTPEDAGMDVASPPDAPAGGG